MNLELLEMSFQVAKAVIIMSSWTTAIVHSDGSVYNKVNYHSTPTQKFYINYMLALRYRDLQLSKIYSHLLTCTQNMEALDKFPQNINI